MEHRIPTLAGLFPVLVALAACGAPAQPGAEADRPISCEELAQRRATQQYDSDTASTDQRLGGSIQDSTLRRQFLTMDAAARRREVYEECLRLRSVPVPPAAAAGSR